MRNRRSLFPTITLLLILFATRIVAARDWETFSRHYHGVIGNHKVNVYLLNRFGTLSGNYYYSRYEDSVKNNAGSDDFTIDLTGTKRRNHLHLEVTCYWCEEVKEPETFEGTFIGDTAITGLWIEKHGRKLHLPFYLTCEPDTSQITLPQSKTPNLSRYKGKSLWNSGFFDQPFVQRKLQTILGNDLDDFIKFLQFPLAETGHFWLHDSLLTYNLWIPHNGPSDECILDIDTLNNNFYIFWCGAPDAYIKVYGKDIPQRVLNHFASSMNSQWGRGSRRYIIRGQTIEVEDK